MMEAPKLLTRNQYRIIVIHRDLEAQLVLLEFFVNDNQKSAMVLDMPSFSALTEDLGLQPRTPAAIFYDSVKL